MSKLFDCDECGSAIEADEEYTEVESTSSGEPKTMLRLHADLCLPAHHVMHPRDAGFKTIK